MSKKICKRELKFVSDICIQNPCSSSLVIECLLMLNLLASDANSSSANLRELYKRSQSLSNQNLCIRRIWNMGVVRLCAVYQTVSQPCSNPSGHHPLWLQ